MRGGRNKQRSIQVISSRDLRGKHQQQHSFIRTVDAADFSRSHTAHHNLVSIPLIPQNNRVQTSCKLGVWNACSLGNKSASVNELIISKKLDIMCIVESSHESSSSPSLIASTPPGYTFAERARPLLPNVDLAHIRGPRGGGICIFHKNNFQSTIKDLGNFTSFELLLCYFTFRDSHLLIAVIYRPGSEPVTCKFFSEFTELLSSVAKYSCDLIILGDINIHLDRDIADTKKFNNLLSSHGLVQLVTGPLHRRGHTLDVVITRPSSLITEISAGLPSLSDHSIITFSACHEPPTTIVEKVERRCYKTFDPAAFSTDLQETELTELAYRPTNEINVNVDQLFDLYDTTMTELLDRHAPLKIVTVRKKTDCPWFDAECNASEEDHPQTGTWLQTHQTIGRRNILARTNQKATSFIPAEALRLSQTKN